MIDRLALCLLVQFFCTAIYGTANDFPRGIQFETQGTWKELLAKAKAANKMIFVDCYATWCTPCKQMDRDVYTVDSVGRIFNSNFICVKMQMDSSRQDDEITRKRYPDAEFIRRKFRVIGYPTFLFFNSAGKVIDHRMGAMDAVAFMRMGVETKSSGSKYDSLLAEFRRGQGDSRLMASLLWTALRLNDTAVANEIFGPYFRELNAKDWFFHDNIQLLSACTKTSSDSGFRFFFLHSAQIDKVMGSDVYAEDEVQRVIFREVVKPWLEKSGFSDTLVGWPICAEQITKRYGKYYSDRVLLYSRMENALKKKRWAEYTHDLVKYLNVYGPHRAPLLDFVLNNSAWVIFQHSTDSEELQQALSWSGEALLVNPNGEYMDTYANICYKLGRMDKAIRWEEDAVKIDSMNMSFKENLLKMRNRKPTWPLQ